MARTWGDKQWALNSGDTEEMQYDRMKKIVMYSTLTLGKSSANLPLIQRSVWDIDILKQLFNKIINKLKKALCNNWYI